MLQRQIIFKQLQEMWQQQQLQELGDVRQQNYMNQLSLLNKQSSGGLRSPLVNGMPVHDASQKFMAGNTHMNQYDGAPEIQGFPNGLIFSQAHSQAMSIGMLPEQPDVSFYGSPITSSGGNVSQYSHLQTVSYDSASMLARGDNNQMEIPVMQPSTIGNSFTAEQFNASTDKFSILDGTFVPKSLFQEKNLFGQVPMPPSNDGVLPLNFQQVHMLQRNASMKESGERQEQTCWPVISPVKTPKLVASQGTASLDPLEEKILFNTDDSSWESALGRHGNIAASSFEGTREHVAFMGTFSSTQSGSWSALMQSAVAEASSSDAGQQEEWSGLTFQNQEPSADNRPTRYSDNGKLQTSWVDDNLRSVSSPTSKTDLICPNSNSNYSFPGFQQSSYQREGMHSDSSHESIQHSPNNVPKWFDCSSQQEQPVERRQLVQTASPVQCVWHDQQFEHSEIDRLQSSLSRHTNDIPPCNNIVGQVLRENVWQNWTRPQPFIDDIQNPSYPAAHSSGNQEQMYPGQLNITDNVSNIGMSSGKVHMLGIQKNLSTWKDIPPRKKVDSIAALFDNPADFCGQSNTAQPSENMLDLINKGTSLEYSSGIHLGSRDSVPLSQVFQLETADDLPYGTLSSASHSVNLRLGPSAEQMPKSYSSLNSSIPVNSGATFTSLYMGNQLQNQHMHVAPLGSQSAYKTHPGFARRFQASIAPSRDASNMFQTSTHSQEYPALKTMSSARPSLMSAVPQQIGLSMGPSNVPVPNQHQALQSEALQVSLNSIPSPDSTNSSVEMAMGTPNVREKQNKFRIRGDLKEINVYRGISQGGKEHQAGLLNSSEVSIPASHNRLVHGQESVMKHLSEIKTTKSGSSMVIAPHQAFDITQQNENRTSSMSERDTEQSCLVATLVTKKEASKQLSPPFLLPSDDTEQDLAVLLPKKRKVTAFDFLPWHREVTQGSQKLRKIWVAESEWASASNRLSEKVEDKAEMVEDVLSKFQAKKRLVLTTQLMQQLLRPAPAVLLSADAFSSCESIAYFVCRLALGDVCSLISDFRMHLLSTDMSSTKQRHADRIVDRESLKTVENFIDRAKRLQSDFLRLNQTPSIVDIGVESRELEKFSVINRFAKFHGRGNTVSVETSASGASPAVLKTFAQRYVVAHPMPKMVPDGTNCLSL